MGGHGRADGSVSVSVSVLVLDETLRGDELLSGVQLALPEMFASGSAVSQRSRPPQLIWVPRPVHVWSSRVVFRRYGPYPRQCQRPHGA